jgi:mannose-6-phosphate isomerase-like protein (cupin superfamily)
MKFSSKACTAIALGLFAAASWAQQPHHYITAAGLKWTDVPSLPGAQIAVLEGTMSQAAPFTVRLRFPANYRLPPHSHPAVERVTVLSGTFHMGMGGKFERNKTRPVRAGDVMIMQPGTPHFAWTDSETVVQLHGTGPWGVTYLNAADDPRNNR